MALPVALIVGLLLSRSAHDAKPPAEHVPRKPVAASPLPASGDATNLCPALIAALPATVGDEHERPVSGAPATRAKVWGNPPIVLRCGVSRPTSLVPGVTIITVQDVDWDAFPVGAAVRWTAVYRTAYVEVVVPNAYQGQGALIAAIAPAIAAHDPKA